MVSTLVDCPECRMALSPDDFNTSDFFRCPGCESRVRVDVFPALFRQLAPVNAGEVAVEGAEASCFYHPNKKASVPCSACGRFLCALCDMEVEGKHICPQCLEAGKEKRKIKNLETQRVLYDDVALALAIIPMIFYFVTIISAPAVLYVAIRYWKSPSSIIPRSKARFVIAVCIASLQIAGWIMIIAFNLIR